MESLELKLRMIDEGQFPVTLTKKMVEMFGDPEMSIEVKAGEISEDVSRLLDSLGYVITVRKPIADWILLKAVKQKKQ